MCLLHFSSYLSYQVEHRDKEIERLGRLLEGGRPLHAIMKDTRQDSSDKVVAHLNVQVRSRVGYIHCKTSNNDITMFWAV